MNNIILAGRICREPLFSHYNEQSDKKFYDFYLEAKRKSGLSDKIRCFVDEETAVTLTVGQMIEIHGEIRSKTTNFLDDTKRRLLIFVYVQKVGQYLGEDRNDVKIHGYVVKQPFFRITPLGREITDLLIASNRMNGKSDYIPAIAWNGNAGLADTASVGTELEASGRLQSREYKKKFPDGSVEHRTTYELSINDLALY